MPDRVWSVRFYSGEVAKVTAVVCWMEGTFLVFKNQKGQVVKAYNTHSVQEYEEVINE